MSTSQTSIRDRVRNGLQWPDWQSWSDGYKTPEWSIETGPVDHASRATAIRRRLDLAKTIGAGGPYLEVFATEARERLEAETGTDQGSLANFTFAVKDLVAIEGRLMTAGSNVRSDALPELATAPIVMELERLGAFALGRVTLHEFAFGVTGVNAYAGTALNPKAPGRITGGSSSGSAAAVADGSARIAIGTDTGGSIRGPASFCGVVGFKPSFGTYSSTGVFPLSGTLDHVGLFASNMADIIATHRALGHRCRDRSQPDRIGVARAEIDAADAEVQALMTMAIQTLTTAGIDVVDVTLPDAERTFAASTAIMFSEAAAIHAQSLATHPDRYGADIKARLELGASLTAVEVATAHELKRRLEAEVRNEMARASVPVIIGPTTPMVAPPIATAGDPALPARIVANTRLGNVTGMPAVSLPLQTDGPPVGIQVTGFADSMLLGFAAAIEAIMNRSG